MWKCLSLHKSAKSGWSQRARDRACGRREVTGRRGGRSLCQAALLDAFFQVTSALQVRAVVTIGVRELLVESGQVEP